MKRYLYVHNNNDIELSDVIDNIAFGILNKIVKTIEQVKPDLVIIC